MPPDDPGGVIKGLAGQRQRGRAEKHLEPLGNGASLRTKAARRT